MEKAKVRNDIRHQEETERRQDLFVLKNLLSAPDLPILANIDRGRHLAVSWDDGLRFLITQGRIGEMEVLYRKGI